MRHKGEQQKDDADQRQRVAVALEVDAAGTNGESDDERGDPSCGPHRLGRCLAVVEVGDENVAHPVEERGERQEDWVSLRCQPSQAQVCDEHQAKYEHQERDDACR